MLVFQELRYIIFLQTHLRVFAYTCKRVFVISCFISECLWGEPSNDALAVIRF